MSRRIVVGMAVVSLLAIVSASSATANSGVAGVVLREGHSPYAVAGQPLFYTIMVGNSQKMSWDNVVLKAYLPNQSADKRLTTISSSVYPYHVKVVFSTNQAQWSVKRMTPQANFRISLYTKPAMGVTGKLCNTKIVLMIAGRVMAQKVVNCIPIRAD